MVQGKMIKIKLTKAEFKDKELFERVNKLYSKLSKEDLKTLLEWVSVNCDVVEERLVKIKKVLNDFWDSDEDCDDVDALGKIMKIMKGYKLK